MSAHTPGPWRVGGDGGVIWGAEWKGNAVYVAATPFSLEPRVKADARLIAAAPELLDALKEIESFTKGESEDDPLSHVCAVARTAIAKATGATP